MPNWMTAWSAAAQGRQAPKSLCGTASLMPRAVLRRQMLLFFLLKPPCETTHVSFCLTTVAVVKKAVNCWSPSTAVSRPLMVR